ncbi:Holliday junction branch migration protein RuvA [Candidatus Saccharibacteria bacterium]|nr:Holliday junction branch migration protein RuvA [Candidatus Saccharibacteria bacterium]
MIAHLNGTVTEKDINSIILDVNGVGYEVILTALDFENITLNDKTKIYTYHKVAEQSEELYGFFSLATKRLFEMLITVQGIGPKAAMGILSLGEAEEVRNAIANADSAFVAKATGVGKKSAERVIIDLRDKVGLPSKIGRANDPLLKKREGQDDALDALIALGFSLSEANNALVDIDSSLPVEERIKLALKKR